MKAKLNITARILPDGEPIKVIGREAWALRCLIHAGSSGCTPIDHPGPRWSAYVLDLRKMGFLIETINEKHGGPFAGSHARYRMVSDVALVFESDRKEAA